MKKFVALLLSVVFLFAMLPSSFAGTSTNSNSYQYTSSDSDLEQRLIQAPVFKFWNHKNGIGYGNCPVYTAPSTDSFRCANGKASCSTDSAMGEAGFFDGWLLVRYETNNGGVRVGYIPPNYVRGFKSEISAPAKFDFIPVTAMDTIHVTDNPMMVNSEYATLDPGEIFYVLGKYTYYGDWWYIECTVDGQRARGFIDRANSNFIVGTEGAMTTQTSQTTQPSTSKPTQTNKYPDKSPLGTYYIGEVEISYGSTGARKMVRQDADTNSRQVSVAYPGKKYPYYAEKRGSTGKTWYYIYVDDDSAWGWISSGYATPVR